MAWYLVQAAKNYFGSWKKVEGRVQTCSDSDDDPHGVSIRI